MKFLIKELHRIYKSLIQQSLRAFLNFIFGSFYKKQILTTYWNIFQQENVHRT